MRVCEAMVKITVVRRVGPNKQVYSMCGRTPVERHHRLTRARGGVILDRVGETYHLMDLCHEHHRMADGGDARAGGLLIDGYVTTCTQCGNPEYAGPDRVLQERYGRSVHMSCVREAEASDHTG